MNNRPSAGLLCGVVNLNSKFSQENGGIIRIEPQEGNWVTFVFGNGKKRTIEYTEMDLTLITF